MYHLMDWLADLGGVSGVILSFAAFIFGGYIEFHSGIVTLTHFYSNECLYKEAENTDQKEGEDMEETNRRPFGGGGGRRRYMPNMLSSSFYADNMMDFSKMKISLCKKYQLYFCNLFCCTKCCRKDLKELKDEIDAGIE